MYTKRQRVLTWGVLSAISILIGFVMQVFAEIYFPDGHFYTIASFIFASGAVLGIIGIILSFVSLAWNDWQESKNTATFVNLAENDRIISVHKKVDNPVVHLGVVGSAHQTILAPSQGDIPRIINDSVEHIHIANQLPKVQVMDEKLYQQLFGHQED